jgi:hypothetical protein
MRPYLISVPMLTVLVAAFASLWFFGLLNQREPKVFYLAFSRTCSNYAHHPTVILYLYPTKPPEFRFMLHQVDNTGNRITNKETCSRLFLYASDGMSDVVYMFADSTNKLQEVMARDFNGNRITLVSQNDVKGQACAPPVFCLGETNVIGVQGSLKDSPSRISFAGWAAYFAVTENVCPFQETEYVCAPLPDERTREQAIFEIGLSRGYELTGQTAPQPTAYQQVSLEKIDSLYKFEPQKWAYIKNDFTTSVLISYQSRLLAAIRDSTLFLLAAILGVAFQASFDAMRRRKDFKQRMR